MLSNKRNVLKRYLLILPFLISHLVRVKDLRVAEALCTAIFKEVSFLWSLISP